MGVVFGIFFIIVIILIILVRTENQTDTIESKITGIGGTLIGFEKCNFFSGIGPFMVIGKGRVIYRIEYEYDGIQQEGWVRFGGLGGPDWRLPTENTTE
jgi:uncharacterized membrane protein